MPSLIDIRRRIRSVKNMQQITKAMKMVSAAKLRRAQDQAIASRPYAEMMRHVLSNITAAAAGSDETASLPLLQVREEKRVLAIVVTSDTGLAGAFNSNLLKSAHAFVDEHKASGEIQVDALGRKGRDYFRRRGYALATEHIGVVDKPHIEKAREIAARMIDLYSTAKIDAAYVIGNEFKSVMSPNIVTRRILPVELPKTENTATDYIFEQPPEEQLAVLLPRYVEMSIYRAMLESISAYHAARMTAMDAASSNAGDVISDLTLYLNRVRQASITREIIEIVSGAAAL